MGIDRIGSKGPPVPAVPDGAGTARSGAAGSTFQVHRGDSALGPQGTQTLGTVDPAAAPPTALDRLRAGTIDLKTYIDIKVDEATSHLSSMPSGTLDSIRSALRERLAHDPGLADLVRAATGQVPPGADD